MQCRNCQAKLPFGKVRCPECSYLNPYNMMGYINTKEIQTALKKMIDEQYGIIADTRQFKALMFDYIPEYYMERTLLRKAVDAGFLEAMIGAEDKKKTFKALRNKLMSEDGFHRYEAEFVLVCFGHMLGFSYVSPMFVDDKDPEREGNSAGTETVRREVKKTKSFGKLDAFKYALSAKAAVKEGYTELSAYCFENYGLLKEISLPSTLNSIGEYAFTDCKNLESITIPESVRKLEKGVFNACLRLREIAMPDSVSSIGENAFSGCAELEKLIVPRNVKFIDKNAFAYCGKLTVVCTENSFVHKYCMQNGIKYKTLPMGVTLPDRDEAEGELDE